MKKGSIKNNRINGEVLRAMTEIISSEVKDPQVDPMLTVTRVEVTPDLQFCKCYVSSLGSEEELASSAEGLTRAKGFIRTALAHRVNLRKTPELTFIADRSMEYAIEMSKKIDEILKEAGYEGTAGSEGTEEEI